VSHSCLSFPSFLLFSYPTLFRSCHRVFVLSAPPQGVDIAQDVDAEVVWANGSVAASDRTDSPDAALLVCTGERRLGVLSYAGSRSEEHTSELQSPDQLVCRFLHE